MLPCNFANQPTDAAKSSESGFLLHNCEIRVCAFSISSHESGVRPTVVHRGTQMRFYSISVECTQQFICRVFCVAAMHRLQTANSIIFEWQLVTMRARSRSIQNRNSARARAHNGSSAVNGVTAVVYRFSLWSINDSIYDYKFKSSHIYSQWMIAHRAAHRIVALAADAETHVLWNVIVVATELHRRSMSLASIFNAKLYTIKWWSEGRSHRELYAGHFTFWIAI